MQSEPFAWIHVTPAPEESLRNAYKKWPFLRNKLSCSSSDLAHFATPSRLESRLYRKIHHRSIGQLDYVENTKITIINQPASQSNNASSGDNNNGKWQKGTVHEAQIKIGLMGNPKQWHRVIITRAQKTGFARRERRIGYNTIFTIHSVPNASKRLSLRRRVYLTTFLVKSLGIQVVYLAGTRRFQPTWNHSGECKGFKAGRIQWLEGHKYTHADVNAPFTVPQAQLFSLSSELASQHRDDRTQKVNEWKYVDLPNSDSSLIMCESKSLAWLFTVFPFPPQTPFEEYLSYLFLGNLIWHTDSYPNSIDNLYLCLRIEKWRSSESEYTETTAWSNGNTWYARKFKALRVSNFHCN